MPKKKPRSWTPTLLALRIRRARLNSPGEDGKKMTQTELAELLGMASHSVYLWEAGKTVPSRTSMEKLVHIFSYGPGLGVDPDEVWLDIYELPPDMLRFLVTTREGANVVKNIRKIMINLERTMKPTHRREIPKDVHIADHTVRKSRS